MNKRILRYVGSISILSLSLASLFTGAYCWYQATRNTSLSVVNIGVKGSDFNTVSCIIYRGDGAKYDCSSQTYYDSDGNVVDSTFYMLEYDRIITEKNTFNNLIFVFDVDYNSGIDVTTAKTASFSTSFSSKNIFTQTDNKYALSDVTCGSVLINDGSVDTTKTNLEIYKAGTSFLSGEDVTYGGFLQEDASSTYGYIKPDQEIKFNLTIPVTSIVDNSFQMILNVKYDEDYLSSFFTNLNFSSDFEDVSKQSIDFRSDISFMISSEA